VNVSQFWLKHILFHEAFDKFQAAIYHPVAAETQDWSLATTCVVYGGQSGTGTSFPPSTSISFPPVSVIVPVLCIYVHSFSHHRHCIIFTLDSIDKLNTWKNVMCVVTLSTTVSGLYGSQIKLTCPNYSKASHCTKMTTSCKNVAWKGYKFFL
jgi:hypothetical protein